MEHSISQETFVWILAKSPVIWVPVNSVFKQFPLSENTFLQFQLFLGCEQLLVATSDTLYCLCLSFLYSILVLKWRKIICSSSCSKNFSILWLNLCLFMQKTEHEEKFRKFDKSFRLYCKWLASEITQYLLKYLNNFRNWTTLCLILLVHSMNQQMIFHLKMPKELTLFHSFDFFNVN